MVTEWVVLVVEESIKHPRSAEMVFAVILSFES